MKQREFMTLVGGAAVWPIAARAQRPVRRIGILMTANESDPATQSWFAGFRRQPSLLIGPIQDRDGLG